jgi:hypothetical protein
MKLSIWDLLTGLTLLGILCLIAGFAAIALDPSVAFNPLQPPATVAPIILPSATATEPGLPPTWTPVPSATSQVNNTLPTLRPSRTPEPTATRVILPTFTPSKTIRPTTPSGGGGGSGAVGGGSCDIIYQYPADDTVMVAGTPFDMRWTIKNTGSDSWRADSIDVRYMSGAKMHSGNDLRDLPYDVGAGGAVDILISMRAPTTKGIYTTNWALTAGNAAKCRFFVVIEVQ